MQPLEIVISALLGIYLSWPHPRPMAIRLLPALTLAITLIHFNAEGYRWQMLPIYTLTALLTISSLTKIVGNTDWKPIASNLTLVLLALSVTLPTLLPVPKIPKPSGDFMVGTRTYDLTDLSRKEIYSGKDEHRRIMIQVWYPADVRATDQRAPWMANAKIFAPAIATFINLPPFFLDHLALVKVPAYENSQVAKSEAAFPVIIFSHGWNGFNAQNTGQALELASHGYVVAAIQHTYGAVVTVFSDGTIVPNNPNALPSDENDPNYEAVAQKLVNQWAGDISFTLNQLSDWENDSQNPFYQQLDLNRVGIYGHSTGGGAAIQFCGIDSRCKAVLGMDPFIRPVSTEVIDNGLPQPAFFMFSQQWADITESRNNVLFNQFYPEALGALGAIVVEGTRHHDFTDLPFLSPIAAQLGLKGPLNGKRMIEITNSYLLSFFDMTLKNKTAALFNGSFTTFKEVVKRNNANQ